MGHRWMGIRRIRVLGLALALIGCEQVEGPDPIVDETTPDGFELSDEVRCEAPTEGFSRLQRQDGARGLDAFEFTAGPGPSGLTSCPMTPGSVAVGDLERDGDLDLAMIRRDVFPILLLNDGRGGFETLDLEVETGGRSILTSALYDVDGDGLLDVVSSGAGSLMIAPNLGDLAFGPYEVIYEEPDFPRGCISTFNFGDVDGDGDLDLLAPRLETVTGMEAYDPDFSEPPPPSMDLLFLNEDGEFTLLAELPIGGEPGLSLTGFFTDRDGDGDLDIYVSADRYALGGVPPAAFYRNDGLDADGLPILTNDASEIGTDVVFDAMGMGSADLNGDNHMDYCMSDVGVWIPCLMSDGYGGYYEAGLAMNLVPDLDGVDAPSGPETGWATWGVALEDFDNDGELDLAAAAGPPPFIGEPPAGLVAQHQPDVIFEGTPDGLFIERTDELGFGDPTHHHGLVAADFDRDGSLDLVVTPREGPPIFWSNPCSEEAWIQVDLEGPEGNRDGLGATVSVVTGDRSRVREMHGLLAVSQAPAELHYGLGDAAVVDSLKVLWADGSESEARSLPVRRRITVTHPSLLAD